MRTRTRRLAAVAALALPLALLGCGDEGEAGQFDQAPGAATGDEGADDASEEGDEEPATAPQVGAEE